MSELARYRFEESSAALRSGDLAGAERLILEARRLSPNDPQFIHAHALLKIGLGKPGAIMLFEQLLESTDVQDLRIQLAIAKARFRDFAGASKEIGIALSSHGLGDVKMTLAAGLRLTRGMRIPGACGLDTADQAVAVLTRRRSSPIIRLHLDRRPIKLRIEQREGVSMFRLPTGWKAAKLIEVTGNGTPLVGSPISIENIIRTEGFVWEQDGGLEGWAWHPGDIHTDPVLTVRSVHNGKSLVIAASEHGFDVPYQRFMAKPRRFKISADQLREMSGLLELTGPDGKNLFGSPLIPSAWVDSAAISANHVALQHPASPPRRTRRPTAKVALFHPMPAHLIGARASSTHIPRPVDIVVPVYGARRLAMACLATVTSTLPEWARVVVVDDASSDVALSEDLADLAAKSKIVLLRHDRNLGFPQAANTGMRHDLSRDVVLLNSDTLVPEGWLDRLRALCYSSTDIGTATPISNDATILSYPVLGEINASPDRDRTRQLDLMAQRANPDLTVDVPTGVGFCIYIKRDCLDSVGLMRPEVFAQGYGEENDFCIRARHLGWRHVAVPGVFVAHVGGQSFGMARRHLIERNLRTLNALHPGYDSLIASFIATDPLAEARRRIDREIWISSRTLQQSVLLVTHGRLGGVKRRVEERARDLHAQGLRPIFLRPMPNRISGKDCVLGDGPEGHTPNLRFAVPSELDSLAELLKGDQPLRAEIHHLIGHDHGIIGLFSRLGIPYEIVVHDYASFCPRIALVDSQRRYCGEPEVDQCETCVANNGAFIEEDIPVPELVRRSRREFHHALRVVVPTVDVGQRLRRHFSGIEYDVVPWENDASLAAVPRIAAPVGSAMRVVAIGAISIEKGYDVLLEMARDADRRSLPIEYRLVGFSCDDARLLATGRVQITGAYNEGEAVDLIRQQVAHVAVQPAVWPETWSYTLSQAWQAGLDVLAFDLGSPAERIRKSGRGWLLPLNASPAHINNQLLKIWQRETRTLPLSMSRTEPKQLGDSR